MTILKITLPFPPSLNSYKRIGKIVRTDTGKLYQQRVNSDETRIFYHKVWTIAKQSYGWVGSKFYQEPNTKLEVKVWLYPPHNKPYDVDNRAKVLIDSLMHSKLIYDDSQIYRLVMQKCEMVKDGQTIVEIGLLE